MKSPRPRARHLRVALAALSLPLLALIAQAQDSKPLRHPDGPFTTREVMKRAAVTESPAPSQATPLPDDAPFHGVVRLRAVLSYTGEITNITVAKGLPGGLTERAIEAAKLIKFTPAQRDGRPVSQYVTLEYNFNIYYEEDDRDITKRVEILEQPKPRYTGEALKNRVAGKVVIEAIFTEDGKVEMPRVIEGLPYGLSESAVEAAPRIKFRPAESKGRKVRVIRRVEYVFPPDSPAPTKP